MLSLIPINSLDERQQDQVLAAGDIVEFKRRRVVFKAGTRDPYTFYLLSGQLELEPEDAAPMRMDGNDPNALRALAQLQPRRYTARAMVPVQVFRIERETLDRIMTEVAVAEHDDAVEVTEIEEDEDGGDWMTRLLNSELFTRLPHDNIQRFFAELQPLEIAKGGVVAEQGTPGDFLYIVAEGLGEVVRRVPGSGQEIQLGSLKEGDTFGEESLLSDTPRNASVRMTEGGVVMRLPKRSFEELVRNPTLKAVDYAGACKLVDGGAAWLDVRFKDEHDAHAIEGSINAPLNALRIEARKLERSRLYVVYCDDGARSSTGAFQLARMGFEVCYLAGGIEGSPLAQGEGTVDDFEMTTEEAEAPREPEAPAAAGSGEAWNASKIKDYAAKARAERRAKAAASKAKTEPESARAPQEAPQEAPPGEGPQEAEKAGKKSAKKARKPDKKKKAAEPEPDPAPVQASAPEPAEPGPREPGPGEPGPAAARAAGQAAAQAAQAAEEQARLRAQLEALTAERDKSAQLLERAAGAGRELKRRYDELQNAAQAERARREDLERELAALQAETERRRELKQRYDELQETTQSERARREELERDVETLRAEGDRQLELERKRLEGELEKAMAKLAELQEAQASAAADSEQARSESERARAESERVRTELEARAGEAEERLKEATARVEALEASAAESEAALQEARRQAEEALAAERARGEKADSEVARLNVELESLVTSARQAQETNEARAARASALESAVAKAKAAAEAERVQIAEARSAVAAERKSVEERADALRTEHQRLEHELAEARAALTTEASTLRSRAEALERRETGLAQHRQSIEAGLASREQALAEGEAALGQEKQAWREEVERAIGAERERLRAELAERKKEVERIATQAIESKIADMRAEYQARLAKAQAGVQETAAIRAEYEARLAQTREDVDAQMADLHEKYTAVLDATRREAEIQRAEQEVLFADQSRQLELENAKLREALSAGARQAPAGRSTGNGARRPESAAQAPSPRRAKPAPRPAQPGAHPAAKPAAKPAPRPAPKPEPAPAGADSGLDLEIDMGELHEPDVLPAKPKYDPLPVIELDASREVPAKAAPDAIPTIDPGAMADPESDDRARVLSAGQIADIRRNMQAKIAASKKKSA